MTSTTSASPLSSSLPTTSRHSGWDPDSSLTYPYTFPSDCSTETGLWLEQTTCQPLTGDYYSPAICPSGWTAAFTRPVLGYGPPVEADETAMLCCPSGMTRLEPACGTGCVSATMTSGYYETSWALSTSGLFINLIEVRSPIQIRWAESDLAILETHPLTPGLLLSHPTATINPIPPPQGLYKAGLGLAFGPLAFVCSLATTFGALILCFKSHPKRKQSVKTRLPDQPHFKPKIFSWMTFLLIFGFLLSTIILLELSCHILSPPNDHIRLRGLEITKTYVSDTLILLDDVLNATATLPFGMTCGVMGSASLSTITTQDRGTSTTITKTYGTTECSSLGLSIGLPSCNRPPTAPRPTKWLSTASQQEGGNQTVKLAGSVEGAFFLANVLPTLLGALFSLPWKIMHVHATSLEPFHQMTTSTGGSMATTIFGKYGFFKSLTTPITLLTTSLVYSSSIITILASEAWGLSLVGTCVENENAGCVPIIHVVSKAVHSMQAMLVFIALLSIALVIVSSRWSAGVFADPRSILGIATLAQSPALRSMFSSLDVQSSTKDLKKQIGDIKVHVGTDVSNPAHPEYGILLSGQSPPRTVSKTHKPGSFSITRVSLLLTALTICLSAFLAVIIYYTITDINTSFEHFMSSQSFGPRALFTFVGILINFGWVAILKIILQLAPYYFMSLSASKGARASNSILIPYATDQYSALIYGLRTGNLVLLTVTIPTILSDFLPLLLANVPFRRTTTWNAHIISSWTAVAVLSLMISCLMGLLMFLLILRPRVSCNVKLLRDAPIAGTLMVLFHSEDFVGECRDLARLSMGERDNCVRRAKRGYRLVEREGVAGILAVDA